MPKKFTGYEGLMGVKVPFAMVGDKSLRLSEGLGVLDRATGFAKNAAVILDGEGMLRRREVREYGEQRFMVRKIQSSWRWCNKSSLLGVRPESHGG